MMTVTIPPAELIEMARDSLKHLSPEDLGRQHQELHEAIGAEGLSTAFVQGYDLGLQTARVLLRQAPPGAHPSEVL